MTPDKELYFENATKKLLKTIDSMGLSKIERLRAKNLILLFRDSFKLPDVKYKTFYPDLGDEIDKFTYYSDGFCRAASINFAKIMGGVPNWQLQYIDKIWTYGPHHYLLHTPSQTVLDLTYDQYTNLGLDIPYYLGQPIECFFEENDTPERFNRAVGLNPELFNDNIKD